MAFTSIDNVLAALREEGHLPMLALASRLAGASWAVHLRFDLSMLRLWIKKERGFGWSPDIMVTYGDGRQGGKPALPYVNLFEISFANDIDRPPALGGLDETVAALCDWAISVR